MTSPVRATTASLAAAYRTRETLAGRSYTVSGIALHDLACPTTGSFVAPLAQPLPKANEHTDVDAKCRRMMPRRYRLGSNVDAYIDGAPCGVEGTF